jgi:hypothetical protein
MPRNLPREEAQLVLRGWQEEKRVIHFHLSDGADATGFKCFGIGAIEELGPDLVLIDSRNTNVAEMLCGERYGCTISLNRANWFVLWDWRDVPAKEAQRKELLQDSYDVILTVALGNVRCVLHTLRRSDEF